MKFADLESLVVTWIAQNTGQLIITVALVVLYIVLDRIGAPRFEESADRGEFKAGAATKAIRIARAVTGLFGALILMIVWGVDFGAVLIVGTTTITLLGVALFANWSILSNITAYFVLLLHPKFLRGTFIRVIDADNYVEGYVSNITLFNVELRTEDGETVLYPNNLLLGRVAQINPKDRLRSVGKIAAKPSGESD